MIRGCRIWFACLAVSISACGPGEPSSYLPVLRLPVDTTSFVEKPTPSGGDEWKRFRARFDAAPVRPLDEFAGEWISTRQIMTLRFQRGREGADLVFDDSAKRADHPDSSYHWSFLVVSDSTGLSGVERQGREEYVETMSIRTNRLGELL